MTVITCTPVVVGGNFSNLWRLPLSCKPMWVRLSLRWGCLQKAQPHQLHVDASDAQRQQAGSHMQSSAAFPSRTAGRQSHAVALRIGVLCPNDVRPQLLEGSRRPNHASHKGTLPVALLRMHTLYTAHLVDVHKAAWQHRGPCDVAPLLQSLGVVHQAAIYVEESHIAGRQRVQASVISSKICHEMTGSQGLMHKRIAVPLCAGSRRRCMGQAHCNSGLRSVGNAAVALGVSDPLVCGDAGSAMPSSVYGCGACTYTPSPKIMEMQAAQCKA